MESTALNIKVYGIVQGVGFRPFVSRLATRMGLMGSVCNKGPYVEIIIQGSDTALQAFQKALTSEAPERSSILKMDVHPAPTGCSFKNFEIIESAKEAGAIFVSPDIAICNKCKAELFDKTNRRYLHPFINCTACGPRLTILDSMPYDRERTSMGEFPMCNACHEEYTHAGTRRYDAQPVCCNDCGPEVFLLDSDVRGPAAITRTRQLIANGGIVAIKGIGGFHLCCDATNETAVSRLRTLKHRPFKPFAVMLRDIATAERECQLEPGEREILDGHQKPILLLMRRPNSHLAASVAPGNPKTGVMLPYAPVQLLLFSYPDGITMPDALVMTSGNPAGAPICRTDEDTLAALGNMCDAILSHNRKIRLRADDSVMDYFEGKPYMIRRSRGFAPLPVMLSAGFNGKVLAVGGELKNSFCLAHNDLFYPSPYIGDMSDLRTVQALRESIRRMETLLETQPAVVACDLHPRYNTTRVAEEMGLPVLPIQHHYAHIVSCMAENDTSSPVIGVAFDGTGYGTDGTIWGGEFLRADYHGFTRLGSIRPFRQAGGDLSALEGWRIAIAMLYGLYKDKETTANLTARLQLCDEKNLQGQFFMADRNINCIPSTSAGRLFDAISAILGIRKCSSFEGEASMYLEFAAEAWEKEAAGNEPQNSTGHADVEKTASYFVLPTEQIVRQIVQKRMKGENIGRLAYEFHQLLAGQILSGCLEARARTGLTIAALSGGVFQNQLLLRLCTCQLREAGFQVLLHSLIPPNDGGIALGQAVAAMQQYNEKNKEL